MNWVKRVGDSNFNKINSQLSNNWTFNKITAKLNLFFRAAELETKLGNGLWT